MASSGTVLNLGSVGGGAAEGALARSRMGSLRQGMTCNEVEQALGITVPIPCGNVESVGDMALQFNGIALRFDKAGRLAEWR